MGPDVRIALVGAPSSLRNVPTLTARGRRSKRHYQTHGSGCSARKASVLRDRASAPPAISFLPREALPLRAATPTALVVSHWNWSSCAPTDAQMSIPPVVFVRYAN